MKRLLCLLFVFGSMGAFGQKIITVNYNGTSLKMVLLDLESKMDISFSYAENVVAGKRVTLSSSNITETDLLTELMEQTGLIFEKVSEKQVIISKPSTKTDVCGYLFDSDTSTPLPYATVVLAGTTNGTITDENGFFQIQNVEQSQGLLIEYVGFADKTLKVSDYVTDDCKNIIMLPETQSLKEVVVLAYLTTGIDKNTDGSFTLNNAKQGILPGLVEPDVFQSIQLIPGITSLDESAAGIQIRGGSPDQNLIFFDGIKMYNTGHFFGMISAFNPYVTESAKIYKGGASPEYGDRISGVIDITTDANVPRKTTGGIGINGTHADGFLKAALGEKAALILSARRSYTDVLETPTYTALSKKVFQNTRVVTDVSGEIIDDDDDDISEILGGDSFFFYDTNAKLLLQPSKNDNISISGLLTNNDLDFFSRDEEDVTEDKLIVENQGASFNWNGTKFGKLQHSLKAYYSSFDSEYENVVSEDLEIEERNFRRNTVEDYGFDFNLAYEFIPQHSIKLGYQYSNLDVFFQLFRDEPDGDDDLDPDDEDEFPLPSSAREFNVRRSNTNQANSVYGEYIFRPQNKGLLSLGVRGSHYSSVDELFLEPRVNIEYPIFPIIRVKGTAEKRYQPVSQLIEFEDIQLRLENNIWTLSNDNDIPILESTQLSAGLLVDSNGWTLDIDGYVKNITGLTSFTNGFTNTAEEISQGESDIFGVDVLLKKSIADYRIWLGYTYNNVEYTFEALQANPFPGNNDVTHNFRISNTLDVQNWELSLGWSYRTGTPFTPVDSFSATTGAINFGNLNSRRLPNYHRLDASMLYKFGNTNDSGFRGTFGVSFQNLYNRQIPISVFYRVDENPDTGRQELDQIEQLSLGFMPNATLRLFF
ncbi:carboxypeptidase-like regulatory domain-containing protein [Flagellimonas sp. 389]|uniref:carboxypeptidase-like regulatory domain-containing protein n=1 Tax=Flagellimonas sp. 389 TaxID=2835862 RepID=UPI001BD6DAEC|nr:carboxypeptidase-like regulatory domain-containing protein [Flagellimonas sp. 389]MBS9462218.1 carboxypeptidase-like regulatory domain-containing protein [Flagellimonas sp. 389]